MERSPGIGGAEVGMGAGVTVSIPTETSLSG
jgi:hypothetical protein